MKAPPPIMPRPPKRRAATADHAAIRECADSLIGTARELEHMADRLIDLTIKSEVHHGR